VYGVLHLLLRLAHLLYVALHLLLRLAHLRYVVLHLLLRQEHMVPHYAVLHLRVVKHVHPGLAPKTHYAQRGDVVQSLNLA